MLTFFKNNNEDSQIDQDYFGGLVGPKCKHLKDLKFQNNQKNYVFEIYQKKSKFLKFEAILRETNFTIHRWKNIFNCN